MAQGKARPLAPDKLAVALERIAGWRADPAKPVACPACGREGLTVVDQSARPWAEWYALRCHACGLEHTLHIPMSPPVGGLD